MRCLGHFLERRGVQHHAAANRHHRRKLSDDEAVAGKQQSGIGETQLRKASLSRGKRFLGVKHNFSNRFRRVRVQMYAIAVAERLRRGQQRQRDIRSPCRSKSFRRRQLHAPGQLFFVYTRQVQGSALAGRCLLGSLSMHLHAAHADALPRRKNFKLVFLFLSSPKPMSP